MDRRYRLYSFAAAAILIVAIMSAFLLPSRAAIPAPQAISTVLVSTNGEHGSGVHIGNGFILTAAHVVEDRAEMDVTDSKGHKQTGKVLWANKTYDVALIQVESAAGVAASKLNCAVRPSVGDEVAAVGNPINLQFIHTWGRVASRTEPHEPWAEAFLIDATIAPGMSGGPVFDKAGNLVGLAVGIAVQPIGLGGFAPYAISYVVPISAACTLMGRSA